jgi:cytochrome d ubiquinol oxidase subunit II
MNYLRLKTEGSFEERARAWSKRLWLAVAVMTVVATASTFQVRPMLKTNFRSYPWAWVFPLLTAGALVAGYFCRRRGRERGAFRASTLLIAGLMGSAAVSVYPDLLTSTLDPAYSLTIYNAASSPLALRSALIANMFGMIGVAVYSTYVHQTFSGKVRLSDHGY